jgi:hypothetical protein
MHRWQSSRQSGITFIGWLVLLIPVAIIVYALIRALPKYMTYFSLAKAVEQVAVEYGGEPQPSINAMRRSLQSRFDIEDIEFPSVDDIQILREGDKWVIRAQYEEVAPLFGSVSLLLKFDKSATLR